MEKIAQIAKAELNLVDESLYNLFQTDNEIFKELNYFLKSPKKRIRSLLTILYTKAFSKNVDIDC